MRTRSIATIVGLLMLVVTGAATAAMSADVMQTSQQYGGGTSCQSGYTSIRASNDGGMVCVQCPPGYNAPKYKTIVVNHAVNGYAVCVACRTGSPNFNADSQGYDCPE
jgi:predicted secreted protein